MPRLSRIALVLIVCTASEALAQSPAPKKKTARSRPAVVIRDAELASRSIQVPDGLRLGIFATEPMVGNPVALGIDERGRVYVAETYRLYRGVTDTRRHMKWLDEDMASRSIEDRVALFRKYLSKQEFEGYHGVTDLVRLLEDTDDDGKADRASIFADGFDKVPDGPAAGVVARGGSVWLTCIPDLWYLRDNDGDGRADVRQSLSHGYGVHVNYLGHDLHGPVFGPDGKLYFSIGDRGFNVPTGGQRLVCLDTGAVLRCEPDGSNLEVFATGLRNPQGLAFDRFGNLFTGDNNSDSGDKARWVHVVEGGDSGWRIGYQYLKEPIARGPWNAEKLWYPRWDGQAAYILPPLINIADGPSGVACEPGASLMPDRYRDCFFLCDFRGASGQSGIRSIAMEPQGASFKVVDTDKFIWGAEATDVEFGPDGKLYLTDWIEGAGATATGKGRIRTVFDPARASDPRVREVKTILARGMGGRTDDELARLLGHPNMRVRQEAQFALAAMGAAAIPTLAGRAKSGNDQLARVHAVWGLGQIGRTVPAALEAVTPLLKDDDAEVRAQSARVLGDARWAPSGAALAAMLGDPNPRVRFFAAIGVGKVRRCDAVAPLLGLLRDNADRDPYLRHAAVMGLSGIGDVDALLAAVSDPSASARMGVLLALRRLASPEVARFLGDPEPRLVLEAARAIYDVSISPALPSLANLRVSPGSSEPLLRRILNANLRIGEPRNASTLAELATNRDLPISIRIEALQALAAWAKPPGLDRVVGLWRPLPPRPAAPAVDALRPVLAKLVNEAPDPVALAALRAIGPLSLREAGPLLSALILDASRKPGPRAEALRVLERLHDDGLGAAVSGALKDRDPSLRVEARRLLAKLDPAEAIPILESALAHGDIAERRGAFAALGEMNGPAADRTLSRWLDRLGTKDVPPELEFDLLEAAGRRNDPAIARQLRRISEARPLDDPLVAYRETLVGGDAENGWKIFSQKSEVECIRCHKARDRGGDVGPDLNGIGMRHDRRYLLESILTPDRQIAQGFETLVIATSDGQVHTGIVKEDTPDHIRLIRPDGKFVTVPRADIDEQKRGASAMPQDVIKHLSRREVRDLVEFLATLK
ncbi:MAG: PVC-type heme-binding CxxCH protein [Isosphaeraceae bacterium]